MVLMRNGEAKRLGKSTKVEYMILPGAPTTYI